MPFLVLPRTTAADLCDRYPCKDPVNKWVYGMFKLCAERHVDQDDAMATIPVRATRPVPAAELRRCCRKAYNADPDDVTPVRSEYNPTSLHQWVDRLGFKMSSKWLIDHSPVSVDIGPAEYLDLIHPGRNVCVVHPFKSKGTIYSHGDQERKNLIGWANGNKEGCWFVSNAVNGELVPIDWSKDGKVIDYSLRSGDNITDWSYCVLESDTVAAPDWCAMLVQQPLAIVSLTYTGNDSVHALVRTGASNKKEFQAFRKKIIETYSRLGADPAAVREVQLTRLPNVINGKTGKRQQLLWLNPNAKAEPVVKIQKAPVRVPSVQP